MGTTNMADEKAFHVAEWADTIACYATRIERNARNANPCDVGTIRDLLIGITMACSEIQSLIE